MVHRDETSWIGITENKIVYQRVFSQNKIYLMNIFNDKLTNGKRKKLYYQRVAHNFLIFFLSNEEFRIILQNKLQFTWNGNLYKVLNKVFQKISDLNEPEGMLQFDSKES